MLETLSSEQKKAYLLLKLIIFCYHGLDEQEIRILKETAERLDAHDELKWAEEFINEDPATSFERAREFLSKTVALYDKDLKVSYLNSVWEATNQKGFLTEMEAMAILKLAKDWGVQKDLLSLVRK